MKRSSWFMVCVLVLFVGQAFGVVISSIEDLDKEAAFSFSIISDHRGASSTGGNVPMQKVESWVKANSAFCFGLGDHFGAGTNPFETVLRNDPYFHNNFYPVAGDHDNEIEQERPGNEDRSQDAWGYGAELFTYMNDFFGRPNVEVRPIGDPVLSNGVWYDDQLLDYHATIENSGFTVHLIGIYFGDSSVVAPQTRQFLVDKMNELAVTKTDHDIVMVLAHSNGDFFNNSLDLNYITPADRDLVMTVADFVGDASNHIFRRHTDYDGMFGGTGALWVNSGATITTGSTWGYLDLHVFDNPPRFTCQYLDVEHNDTRTLHVGQIEKYTTNFSKEYSVPMLKYVDGPIEDVDWDNFYLAPEPNDAAFISQNVPATLVPGETATVEVTLENNGDAAWSPAEVVLASQNPQSNTIWTGSSQVALNTTVQPGQRHTFTFNITAPTTPGSYNFQWKMMDQFGENAGWFGALTPLSIVDVKWPTANMLNNPSFEDDVDSNSRPDFWGNNGNYSRSDEDAAIGSYSVKTTGSGSIGGITQGLALTPNTDYHLSIRARFVAGGSGTLYFDTQDVFDAQGTQFGVSPLGSWQYYEANFNSSSNSSIQLRTYTTADFSGTVYIDDVRLSDPSDIISNVPPAFSTLPGTVAATGAAYSYTPLAFDPDSDPITITDESIPSWLTFSGGVLSGTPDAGDIGIHSVTLRVTDGLSDKDQSWDIYVSLPGNDAPVIHSTPATDLLDSEAYSYTFDATDADGDSLIYTAQAPSWMTFVGGVLSGNPDATDIGNHPVVLTVSDGAVTVTQAFDVVVYATPVAPNLLANGSFEDGASWPTSWSAAAAATWSTTSPQDGSRCIQMSTGGGNVSQSYTVQSGVSYEISVWVNAASYLSGAVVFDSTDKYDAGGQAQFVISSVNHANGWTEKTGQFTANATESVTFRMFCEGSVTNGSVYFDNISLTEVGGGNVAPVVTSTPETTTIVNAPYSYTMTAIDREGDTLTLSQVTVPSGFSFVPETGLLSGTPTGVGDLHVELSVSDGNASTAHSFTITVTDSVAGYDSWVIANGITGGPTDDEDGNGLDNLSEYAIEDKPIITKAVDAFTYVYKQRTGDPNLSVELQTCTDLTANNWTSTGYTVLGINVTGDTYDEVTNSIPVTGPQSYIRLKVTDQ